MWTGDRGLNFAFFNYVPSYRRELSNVYKHRHCNIQRIDQFCVSVRTTREEKFFDIDVCCNNLTTKKKLSKHGIEIRILAFRKRKINDNK